MTGLRISAARAALALGMAAAAWISAGGAEANRLVTRWIATAAATQVEREIARGADIEARSRGGSTPLILAAWNDNIPAMRVLLRAGADPNGTGTGGQEGVTAMHRARSGGAVALLFDWGGSVSARSAKGSEPLHLVSGTGDAAAADALIARGADARARTVAGNTPLHHAVRRLERETAGEEERIRVVRLLLGAGADVGARNRSGGTPLFSAAKRWGPAMIGALLDAGADPAPPPTEGKGFTVASAAKKNRKLRGSAELGLLLAAAGEAQPAAAEKTGGCGGHVVKASERRLGDVALTALGDRSRWPEIARLNGITAENPHRTGQCLKLP